MSICRSLPMPASLMRCLESRLRTSSSTYHDVPLPFLFVAYAAVTILAAGHSSPRSLSPDSCITCPTTPACDCPADQQCIVIERSCTVCASLQCISSASGPSQSGTGTGTGAALRLTYGSSVVLVPGLAALALLVLS
ncbi:hypothetical protein C8J57DRAFT_1278162 [Mycena rebaudengoi]|nr:hypothetical protein C8J57DRAFT_1278162 [Mycena rebaudengoi]